jgi:hypothetical protein
MRRHFAKIKRLRKRIRVFELVFGLLVLMVLGVVMILTRSQKEWVKIEMKISSSTWWQSSSPPYWLGESVSVGDVELDNRGEKIAEVLSVKEYEQSVETEKTTRKDFYLTLNLQVAKDRQSGKLKYKNQPLEIGAPLELHLNNTYVSGLVVSVKGVTKSAERKVIIEGVWLNTFPWTAEAIPIGGEMKNGMGQTIAKILDKKIDLADMAINTADGRVLVRKNPLKRDVWIKVLLTVKEQGENLYFREDQVIKIGRNVFIHLPGVDVEWISIQKIFDLDGNQLY